MHSLVNQSTFPLGLTLEPLEFWGLFGSFWRVSLGSIWGPFGVRLGSIWGPFGVHLASIWGSMPGGPSDGHFCCYLQHLVGVRAVSLERGAPEGHFCCYLQGFGCPQKIRGSGFWVVKCRSWGAPATRQYGLSSIQDTGRKYPAYRIQESKDAKARYRIKRY